MITESELKEIKGGSKLGNCWRWWFNHFIHYWPRGWVFKAIKM